MSLEDTLTTLNGTLEEQNRTDQQIVQALLYKLLRISLKGRKEIKEMLSKSPL